MADFAGAVAEIDKIIKTKQSGAIHIVSDNKLARVYVRTGEISSVSYNRKDGVDALTELKEIIQAKVGFHEGKSAPVDDSLPDTTTIMTGLREGMGDAYLSRSFFQVGAPQEVLDKVKDAYVAVIGPIGAMLFEDSLKESQDLPFLITNLRHQMESDADVSEFNRNLERADIWPE